MEKKEQMLEWNGVKRGECSTLSGTMTFAIQACIFIVKDKRYVGRYGGTVQGYFWNFQYLRVSIN